MKFFPNVKTAARCSRIGGFFAARAELTKWAEGISAGNRMEAVFFRNVLLPSGMVPVRRPPKETRPELTKLIGAAPNDAELYSLRALEDEQQLNFTAAEDDWKKYADIAAGQRRRASRAGRFLSPPPAFTRRIQRADRGVVRARALRLKNCSHLRRKVHGGPSSGRSIWSMKRGSILCLRSRSIRSGSRDIRRKPVFIKASSRSPWRTSATRSRAT